MFEIHILHGLRAAVYTYEIPQCPTVILYLYVFT